MAAVSGQRGMQAAARGATATPIYDEAFVLSRPAAELAAFPFINETFVRQLYDRLAPNGGNKSMLTRLSERQAERRVEQGIRYLQSDLLERAVLSPAALAAAESTALRDLSVRAALGARKTRDVLARSITSQLAGLNTMLSQPPVPPSVALSSSSSSPYLQPPPTLPVQPPIHPLYVSSVQPVTSGSYAARTSTYAYGPSVTSSPMAEPRETKRVSFTGLGTPTSLPPLQPPPLEDPHPNKMVSDYVHPASLPQPLSLSKIGDRAALISWLAALSDRDAQRVVAFFKTNVASGAFF